MSNNVLAPVTTSIAPAPMTADAVVAAASATSAPSNSAPSSRPPKQQTVPKAEVVADKRIKQPRVVDGTALDSNKPPRTRKGEAVVQVSTDAPSVISDYAAAVSPKPAGKRGKRSDEAKSDEAKAVNPKKKAQAIPVTEPVDSVVATSSSTSVEAPVDSAPRRNRGKPSSTPSTDAPAPNTEVPVATDAAPQKKRYRVKLASPTTEVSQ